MIDQVLFNWAPIVIVAAVVAFLADWFLTVAGARAAVGVRDRWSVEGSYEMNPAWTAAVDRGRWINARVVAVAGIIALTLALVWVLDDISRREVARPLINGPSIFPAAAGVFLLLEAPTLMQHVGNLTQFRAMADPLATSGQLRIARWFSLQQVALVYLRFSVLWLALAGLSLQMFFVGGALGCAVVGFRFRRLAGAARASSSAGASQGGAGQPAVEPLK
jgi:hypothetical protein